MTWVEVRGSKRVIRILKGWDTMAANLPLHSLLFYPKVALTNPVRTTRYHLPQALLRRFSGAAQEMIRKIAKHGGLDK